MDNHATGNLILSILEPRVDPIPAEVWDRVGEVREVVYRTIADMSPPDWSFVFTNVLVADDPGDRAVVVRLARARPGERSPLPPGAPHVRAATRSSSGSSRPSEVRAHKWTDVTAVERFVRAHDLVDVDGLDIDTTHQSPEQSAAAILAHLERARRGGQALSSSWQIGGSSGLLNISLVSTMPIWSSTGSVYQSLPRPPLHP